MWIETIKRGKLRGLTIFHNSIGLKLENRDLDQSKNHGCYLIEFGYPKVSTRYTGKATIYFNLDGTTSYKSRFLDHKNDTVRDLLLEFGPENCRIYTIENLTATEAAACEAFMQRMIRGTIMNIRQRVWDGENFLNKKFEDKNEELINRFNLYGNNDIKALRRQINGY